MPVWLAIIIGVFGLVVSTLTVLGALWKLVLPWLREQIVRPVQETHRELTVNQHLSDPPTYKDKFDTLTKAVETMSDDGRQTREDIGVLVEAFTRHLVWSDEETRRLWAALRRDGRDIGLGPQPHPDVPGPRD